MSGSAQPENEIYVFCQLDDKETQRSDDPFRRKVTELISVSKCRLNSQHKLVQSIYNGHLVHPAVPYSKITNIADIGCGTG